MKKYANIYCVFNVDVFVKYTIHRLNEYVRQYTASVILLEKGANKILNNMCIVYVHN